MSPNVIRCGGCRLPLATSAEPGAVVIAGIPVHGQGKGVTLQCPDCGRWTAWHRGKMTPPTDSHLTTSATAPHTSP